MAGLVAACSCQPPSVINNIGVETGDVIQEANLVSNQKQDTDVGQMSNQNNNSDVVVGIKEPGDMSPPKTPRPLPGDPDGSDDQEPDESKPTPDPVEPPNSDPIAPPIPGPDPEPVPVNPPIQFCGNVDDMVFAGLNAPNGEMIESGDSIEAAIDSPGDRDQYFFDGTPADQVVGYLENRSGGRLDLAMVNPDGLVIGSQAFSTSDRNVFAVLVDDGVHSLIVNGEGDTVGAYTLTFNRAFPACTIVSPSDTVMEQIDEPGDMDSYKFSGNRSDFYSVYLLNRSVGERMSLTVLDPDGATLDAQAASTSNRQLNFALGFDGDHVIVVDGEGAGIGDYELTVSRLHPAEFSIEFGQPVQDELYPPGRVHSYQFRATSNQTVSIFLANETAGRRLSLSLLNPTGAIVASAAASTSSRQMEGNVDVDGVYTIVVDGEGDSTGFYTLTLNAN